MTMVKAISCMGGPYHKKRAAEALHFGPLFFGYCVDCRRRLACRAILPGRVAPPARRPVNGIGDRRMLEELKTKDLKVNRLCEPAARAAKGLR